jgi:hypothetical protein
MHNDASATGSHNPLGLSSTRRSNGTSEHQAAVGGNRATARGQRSIGKAHRNLKYEVDV